MFKIESASTPELISLQGFWEKIQNKWSCVPSYGKSLIRIILELLKKAVCYEALL